MALGKYEAPAIIRRSRKTNAGLSGDHAAIQAGAKTQYPQGAQRSNAEQENVTAPKTWVAPGKGKLAEPLQRNMKFVNVATFWLWISQPAHRLRPPSSERAGAANQPENAALLSAGEDMD